MRPIRIGLALIIISLSTYGCVTSENMSGDDNSEDLSLRQHLERASGVTLQGYEESTKVILREENPRNKQYQQPLFVVDGKKWGRNFYRVASSLEPEEINSVRVMASPSMYGGEGGSGVIEITTTDGN